MCLGTLLKELEPGRPHKPCIMLISSVIRSKEVVISLEMVIRLITVSIDYNNHQLEVGVLEEHLNT